MREKKIRNAVASLASEPERLAHRPPALNFPQRFLAFLNHSSVRRVRRQALGLLYSIVGRSPALSAVRNDGGEQKSDRFILVPQRGGGYLVKAIGKPDLDCFSSFEIDQMKRLVRVDADRFDRVPDEGGAARSGKEAEKTSAAKEASDADSLVEYKEECEMSSLHALIQRYVKQLEELEVRTKDVKHKLETVMEASRLLEEEGLSEDTPSEGFGERKPY